MSAVLLAAICILCIIIFNKLSPSIKRQLHIYKCGIKLPGPEAVAIFGNALQLPTADYEMSHYFTNLAQEYVSKGETAVKLWFAHILNLFPLDGKTVKDILDNQEEIDKASDYDVLVPWLGDGLLLSTGEKWKNRRRMLTPTFHFAMLDSYVYSMDRNAKILVDILEKSANTERTIDIFPLLKRCTLDIICETAMGFELDSMTNENHPYAVAVGRMGTMAVEYAYRPWLWFKLIRQLTGFQTEYEEKLRILKGFTEKVIQERIRSRETDGNFSETNRKAFLDMMLDMKETHSLSDEDIREQVDTFMVAGHETTSTAVSWTIWALATHPDIQERLAEEIVKVSGDTDSITLNEMKEMPYLDLVLKESMRINPPVSMVGRCLKSDLKLETYLCPAGTNLYISPLMIHRNPRIYPNPLHFDPDRFLPENSKQRHAYDYIPFSAGPRNCIGQKFAIYEAKVILIWLIRRFKFSTNMGFLENVGCPEIVYRPQHGIPVFIQRRVS